MRGLFRLIIFACVGLFAGVCFSEPTLPKAPYVLTQTVKQWEQEGQKVAFIDVREPMEFEEGHLEGAVNIPYYEIENRRDEINTDYLNVIYCIFSSWRAPYAANTLADLGLDNIYVLEGGISAWNAGGQVVYATDPDQKGIIAPYPEDIKKQLLHPKGREYDEKIAITLEELSSYDGKDGRPVYVAVEGSIYDLTQSRLWRGGEHDPSHGEAFAGRDLTEVLKESPHGDKHLKRFPIVGYLVDAEK